MRAWGVRGSLPVSGPDFRVYGGDTVCIEMQCGEHRLLFDAGSGILPAGKALLEDDVSAFNLFFTHCHYDHIIGLPYFAPLFDARSTVDVWTGHMAGKMTTRQMIAEFIRPPWFPIEINACRANLRCRDFKAPDVLEPFPGLRIKTGNLNHPGGAIGYRVEWQGHSAALITDTEHLPGVLDTAVLELIDGVDIFLYDTTYTDQEMARHAGYGHSSWQQAIRLAKAADAKKVAFIHHSPLRTDKQIKAIDRMAVQQFAGAFSAHQGQVIDL
ncbi:MBL fold metallo-hydrolase [Rhizobium sp. KVB221]|uniref:MBL fold metallo-hydrolase n=1 Tax=Rhizobium setariae TaxID=2801340 RepID=A0A936YVG5_9HYPH|nr:MBL fold metallo-hydrolase [Rhizobium setariae]MBL0373650.1 MBL fold metallo-hydrolase [Rhizobium setariae]